MQTLERHALRGLCRARSLSPSSFLDGERVGVRGSHNRRSKLLPLTLALSPRKSGEKGRD